MSAPAGDEFEALVDSWLGVEDNAQPADDGFDPDILAGFVVESTDALDLAEQATFLIEERCSANWLASTNGSRRLATS